MSSFNKIVAGIVSVSSIFLLMGILVAVSAAETPFEELFIQQPPDKTISQCVVGGCSSQLCVDPATSPIYSTCEWRDEYACYREASCEPQTNGECGWTMSTELKACLGQGDSTTPPKDEIPDTSPFPIPGSSCQPKPACLDEDPPCHIYIPPDGFHWCPPSKPVCGNNICEEGEADTPFCPPCDGLRCPLMPCSYTPGTCPSDCDQHDDPYPIPTTQPLPTTKPLPIICDLHCPNGTTDPLNCRCIPADEEPQPPYSCETSGGNWKEFKNGCADTCAYNSDPGQLCTESFTYSCDCGPGKCWTGSSCQQNSPPAFKLRSIDPSPIQQLIEFFTSFARRFRIH